MRAKPSRHLRMAAILELSAPSFFLAKQPNLQVGAEPFFVIWRYIQKSTAAICSSVPQWYFVFQAPFIETLIASFF